MTCVYLLSAIIFAFHVRPTHPRCQPGTLHCAVSAAWLWGCLHSNAHCGYCLFDVRQSPDTSWCPRTQDKRFTSCTRNAPLLVGARTSMWVRTRSQIPQKVIPPPLNQLLDCDRMEFEKRLGNWLKIVVVRATWGEPRKCCTFTTVY